MPVNLVDATAVFRAHRIDEGTYGKRLVER
jgi:hypothetical protein